MRHEIKETRHGRRREDNADAFIPDPEDGYNPSHIKDEIAETLAENYVQSATSAEESAVEGLDRVAPEEVGGPFVETDASEEFATGTDEMNPEDATREPVPTPMHGQS